MDTDLRTAQRRDRVAWLRGRVRRGDQAPWGAPFAEAIELAAYCGDEVAMALVVDAEGNLPGGAWAGGPIPLAALVSYLHRWPGALERAALAAVEAWLADRTRQLGELPCPELDAARAVLLDGADRETLRPYWDLSNPAGALALNASNLETGVTPGHWSRLATWCAQLVGEAEVREAVAGALIAYAIGI